LKHLKDDKYQIADFGDFAPFHIAELLNIFRFNEKYLEDFSDSISDFIEKINAWLDLTGSEFLIDTKRFRLAMKNANGASLH